MQHVKLARDRRKKRFRIKTVFFLISLTLIFTGLSLNQKESENTAQAPLPAPQNDTAYQSLTADTGSAAAQSAVENRRILIQRFTELHQMIRCSADKQAAQAVVDLLENNHGV